VKNERFVAVSTLTGSRIRGCFLANVNEFTFTLVMSSPVRPSVVCLSVITVVHPTQAIEIGNVLRHLVPWPSVTFR